MGKFMGLFSGIKDNLNKSEAAVVVQTLFEKHQQNFSLSVPPAALANKLIESTWNSAPELFNGGKSGARPHKASIAAYSLACAARGANIKGTNEEMELAFSMCLGRILRAIERTPESFPFTDIDLRLLEQAQKTFIDLASDSKYDLAGC